VEEGKYAGTIVRIEYGSVWAFGPNCGIDEPDVILRAIELCNTYGLDPVSTGNVIGFAMDCFEKGLLKLKDVDYQELNFGNSQAMLEMINKIGHREDIGDILAEGVKKAAKKIGKGAEKLAFHVKGVEFPGYSVGCLKTAALGFAVSFQGADEARHAGHLYDLKGKVDQLQVETGRGLIIKDTEDLYAVMDSLLVCKFLTGAYEGFETLAKLYDVLTGIKLRSEDLSKVGERIINLARLFNLREGLSRKDDTLPQKFFNVNDFEGLSKPNTLTHEELNFMIYDYYSCRGWTREGTPTEEKLEELDIQTEKNSANDVK
jgi:aldehyde:ferredoxin oxidoreductase